MLSLRNCVPSRALLLIPVLLLSVCSIPGNALSAQKYKLGVHTAGDMVHVSARGVGATESQAKKEATAEAHKTAMETRMAKVNSELVSISDESSDGTSNIEFHKEIKVTAAGVLKGAREVEVHHQSVSGKHRVQVTLEMPRERLFPSWMVRKVLREPVPQAAKSREKAWRRMELRGFAVRAREAGDDMAVVYALRQGLLVDPCADYAIDLARHAEDLGNSKRGITILEREVGRIGMTPQDKERVEAELLRLRGMPKYKELLDRLRRVVAYSTHENLRLDDTLLNGRADSRDGVTIKGIVPANRALHAAALDSEALMTPASWVLTPKETQADGPSHNYSYTVKATKKVGGEVVADPELFVPGEVVLIYLSQAPTSGPPPSLGSGRINIRLCTARDPDARELKRFEQYVTDLEAWLRKDGNTGTVVSWMNVIKK